MNIMNFTVSQVLSYLCILLHLLPQQFIEAVQHLGNEAKPRDLKDSVQDALIIPDPSQKVLHDGYIVGWNMYVYRGKRTQKVWLTVWRPINEARKTYQYVGRTIIEALKINTIYYSLSNDVDRIPVRKGDVLGLYWPKYNPIPYSSVKPCTDRNHFHLYNYNPTKGVEIRTTLTLKQAHSEERHVCRKYSFNATIVTSEELPAYENVSEHSNPGLIGANLPVVDVASLLVPSPHAVCLFVSLLIMSLWV